MFRWTDFFTNTVPSSWWLLTKIVLLLLEPRMTLPVMELKRYDIIWFWCIKPLYMNLVAEYAFKHRSSDFAFCYFWHLTFSWNVYNDKPWNLILFFTDFTCQIWMGSLNSCREKTTHFCDVTSLVRRVLFHCLDCHII